MADPREPAAAPAFRGVKPRFTRALSWALVALGLASLLWRLVDLDLAPFILDEPQFLDAARGQFSTGHVLTRSTLVGTSGYYYGGAIFWFYGVVQALAGATPQVALAAMAVTVTAAQLFFGLSVTRATCREPRWREVFSAQGRWVLGATLLLLGSSPHQHLWSRLAWDQLTDAVAFVVAGLVVTLPVRGWGRATAIGAILGFGLSSHPMLAPFAVIAGVAVAVGAERPLAWRRGLRRLTLLGAAAAVVLSPWLLELWRQRGQPGNFGTPAVYSLERMLEVFRGPGVVGIDYFFDGDWASFLGSPHAPLGWVPLSKLSQGLWVLLGAGGLLASLAGRHRRRALFGLATLALYPMFYAWRGIPIQPHYQFPTGWAAVLGAALLMGSPRRWLRGVALGAVLLLAGWQLHFVAGWRSWLAERSGTRGVHYGVPIGEQARVVAAICAHGSGPLVAELQLVAFTPSFAYLASVTPACRTRQVRWCGADRGCAPPRADETVALVHYAENEGARLDVAFSR